MNNNYFKEYYNYNREITSDDVNKFNFPNQKIAVIAHTIDERGKILLQLRGKKADGSNYLYEDIGGKVEDDDLGYRYAMKRELREETGNESKFYIGNSLGIYHNYKNSVNYIFIVYYVKYQGGILRIMEPEKCLGYQFFDYEEAVNSSIVSDGSKFLLKKVRKYHNC